MTLMSEDAQKTTSARIRSFDYIRGLCILIMVITHGIAFWINESGYWFFAFEGAIFGALGASGFVFVSGVSFGFSWAKHKGPTTGKDQYLKSISHTLALLIVGIIFNVFWSLSYGLGWWGIFSWQILQCLAFCRLLSLLFSRINKIGRMVSALGFIALGSILLNLIGFNHPTGNLETIIFNLFFNPLDAYPLLVYLPIFIIGSVFGEAINEMSRNQVESRTFIKRWLLIGCLFVISGIALGCQFESDTFYMGRPGMYWLHTSPALLNVTTYPLLFDLNSYAWCLFYSGIHMILLMSLLYYMDMNPLRKTYSAPARKSLFYLFGTYSLTIYLGHLLAFIIPLDLNYIMIWIPVTGLIVLIYLVIWQLDKVGKGKFSLEYVLGIMGVLLNKQLKKKSKRNLEAGIPETG